MNKLKEVIPRNSFVALAPTGSRGKIAVKGKRDDRYVQRQADKYDKLEHRQVVRLYRMLEKYPQGKREIVGILHRHNQRMVAQIAYKYLNRGLDIEDLMQEGNIGLLRAIEKFDYRLGYQFSTYSVWWIREAIDRAVKNKGRAIRIPVQKQQERIKVKKAYAEGYINDQEQLTSKQLAEITGYSEEKVRKFQTYDYDIESLDRSIASDGPTLGEITPDGSIIAPEKSMEASGDSLYIESVIGQLSPKDALFIKRKFGLAGMPERTDAQMADLYNIPEAKIRRRTKRICALLKDLIDPDCLNSTK